MKDIRAIARNQVDAMPDRIRKMRRRVRRITYPIRNVLAAPVYVFACAVVLVGLGAAWLAEFVSAPLDKRGRIEA